MKQPQVDFYILPEKTGQNSSKSSAIWAASLLCEKAFQQGLSVHFLTQDDNQSNQYNEMLWKFKQNAFIPHSLEIDSDDPVIISNQSPIKPTDVLINLTHQAIQIKSGVEIKRILEIIEAEEKSLGREKYKAYQKESLSLNTHTI